MRLAELQAVHTPQTYAYLFTWQSSAWNGLLGAGHLVEVPFALGTLATEAGRALAPGAESIPLLADQMQEAWLAFARTGDPATLLLPDWGTYSPHRRRTMVFGTQSGPVDAPYEAERQFCEGAETAFPSDSAYGT